MKYSNRLFALLIAIMPASAMADNAFLRPAFLPSTPASDKAISAYTEADVLGIILTKPNQLPANHPFLVDKKYTAGIKVNWPGAKVANTIDTLVQIALDAPMATKSRELQDGWDNIRFILREVIDVSDSVKVDAHSRQLRQEIAISLSVRRVLLSDFTCLGSGS